MYRVQMAALAALILTSCVDTTTTTSPASATAKPRNSHWNDKARMSVRDAERRVGGFNAEERAAYRTGLQYAANHNQKIGGFTIAQVVERQRARDALRTAAIDRERKRIAEAAQERALAADRARERAAAAVQAARDAREAAEAAHLKRGTPDCIILDDRTLHTESGEYTGYIVGKVQNRCERDMRYVAAHFTFLNDAGETINSGLVNVNDLGAGQTWAFRKAVYEVHSGQSYRWRLEKIVGF
jgi:hypothetical protein